LNEEDFTLAGATDNGVRKDIAAQDIKMQVIETRDQAHNEQTDRTTFGKRRYNDGTTDIYQQNTTPPPVVNPNRQVSYAEAHKNSSKKKARDTRWHRFNESVNNKLPAIKTAVNDHLTDLKGQVLLSGTNFDLEVAKQNIATNLEPLITEIVRTSGQERLDGLYPKYLSEETVFDIMSENVADFIKDRLDGLQESVETTYDRFEKALQEDVEEREDLLDGVIKGQLDTISETETVAAENFGDIESVIQSDLGDRLLKTWVSQRDSKVRESHDIADNEYFEGIELDEDFDIGEDSMSAPGLGDDPGENCNCRCTLLYIDKETGEEIGEGEEAEE